jgi:phosphoglycolate phosphatase-like HAD superfamily hydrolase
MKNLKGNKHLIVWDFHGVLEKGNDLAVVDVTNHILKEHGFDNRLDFDLATLLAGKKWFEYFEHLLPKEKKEKHLLLQKKCFEHSNKNPQIIEKHISLNDHAKDVLEKIHLSNHEQILISNTTNESLDKYVKIVNIEKFFSKDRYFAVNAHIDSTYSKQYILDKFLNKNSKNSQVSFEKIISIGDSSSDMDLVNNIENGIAIQYTYPNRLHRDATSHHKINHLSDVLEIIQI